MNTENTTLPVVEVTLQLTPHVAAQVVYEAARRFLAGSMLGSEYTAALTALREAVARADAAIEASKPFRPGGARHIPIPDELDPEGITVYADCAVQPADHGVWYQAWVYVAKPGQEG